MSGTSTLSGVLLLQSAPSGVQSWVRSGTVPAYVVPIGGWTAVVPAGPSAALPPYDDGLLMIAGRPVPIRQRPAVGFFVLDGSAVVALQRSGRREPPRWLTWSAHAAALVLPDHEPASVADLVEVAGLAQSERSTVEHVLRRRGGTPIAMLEDLMDALGLPGADLLRGSGVPTREGAVLVTPARRRAERFDRDVAEEREVRADLDSQPAQGDPAQEETR